MSFTPGVEWAQLSVGSHTPRYSELSGSEISMFGGGIQLTPGWLRLSADRGITQRAIAPDSLNGILGSYRRITTMAKVGFGREEKTFVDINYVKIQDDTTSFVGRQKPQTFGIIQTEIGRDSLDLPIYQESVGSVDQKAEEGVLISINGRFPLDDAVTFVAEGAVAIVSTDANAKLIDKLPITVPKFLLQPRESTHGDFAALSSLNFSFENWGFETKAKYVGAGFVTIGVPFAQSDYFDATVSPRLTLFDGGFSFNGTIGTRTTGVSLEKEFASTQLIVSSNINLIASEQLSFSANYSNFGLRNSVANDTFRVQNVSQSFMFAPTYTVVSTAAFHTITLSIGFDTYRDYNLFSGRISDNNTFSTFFLYSISFAKNPLSLSFIGNYLKNNIPNFGFQMAGGGINAGYRFFEDKLQPSLGFSLNNNTSGSFTADFQVLLRGGLRWVITEKFALNISAMQNAYRYGSQKPNDHFTENTLQASLGLVF